MAKFKINDGNSTNFFTIDAEHFQTKGTFIDFSDADGHTVFWIAQSLVNTIERVREPSTDGGDRTEPATAGRARSRLTH
jgi:uncharacterized protein YxjI